MSALERLIRDGSDTDVRRFFLLLRPPELADVLENVPEDDRLRVVRLMSAPLASEVLRQVQEGDRQDIFEDLSARENLPFGLANAVKMAIKPAKTAPSWLTPMRMVSCCIQIDSTPEGRSPVPRYRDARVAHSAERHGYSVSAIRSRM